MFGPKFPSGDFWKFIIHSGYQSLHVGIDSALEGALRTEASCLIELRYLILLLMLLMCGLRELVRCNCCNCCPCLGPIRNSSGHLTASGEMERVNPCCGLLTMRRSLRRFLNPSRNDLIMSVSGMFISISVKAPDARIRTSRAKSSIVSLLSCTLCEFLTQFLWGFL